MTSPQAQALSMIAQLSSEQLARTIAYMQSFLDETVQKEADMSSAAFLFQQDNDYSRLETVRAKMAALKLNPETFEAELGAALEGKFTLT